MVGAAVRLFGLRAHDLQPAGEGATRWVSNPRALLPRQLGVQVGAAPGFMPGIAGRRQLGQQRGAVPGGAEVAPQVLDDRALHAAGVVLQRLAADGLAGLQGRIGQLIVLALQVQLAPGVVDLMRDGVPVIGHAVQAHHIAHLCGRLRGVDHDGLLVVGGVVLEQALLGHVLSGPQHRQGVVGRVRFGGQAELDPVAHPIAATYLQVVDLAAGGLAPPQGAVVLAIGGQRLEWRSWFNNGAYART